MIKNTFIDRYFHSANELLDFRYKDNRDINTLFCYLDNLHSTGDKLKSIFKCNINNHVEFKILRIIRNYFHHIDDVDEIRLTTNVDDSIFISHSEQLILPLEVWGKSLRSFYEKNKNNKNFYKKEIKAISEYNQDLAIEESMIEKYCNKPSLNLDGTIYELGFDIYKFVYNITNIITEECKSIKELSILNVIQELDSTYSKKNNIEKRDMISHAGVNIILTTKGYIYPDKISRA